MSWAPPAGREDPLGIGVEESPDDDSGRDEEQAKDLIAAEGATLFLAALLFGNLFVVRLDTAVDHRKGAEFNTDQYRGTGVFEGLLRLLVKNPHSR